MRSFKRMMAGLLSLTMLLISCSSGFCSVASPPEADPSPSVSPGESGGPEESPSPSPSPSVPPGEEGARTFTPAGEAWARLADGTLLDGTT